MAIKPPTELLSMYPYEDMPWTAERFVKMSERRTLGAMKWLQDNRWDALVPTVFGEPLEETVYAPSDPAYWHHVKMTAQEVASHVMWEKYRTVCEIHPRLTQDLRSSGSDKFPPEVLRHLPYRNPLVFLSEPQNVRLAGHKERGRLVGWYVVGMDESRHYCDTSDGRAVALHVTVLSEILGKGGAEVDDWDMTRVTLPLTGETCTVDELIARMLSTFAWDPTVKSQTEETQHSFMSSVLHVVLPHMLYLCSENLDTKPKPFRPGPPARRQGGRTIPAKGSRVERQLIGFRVGPELAAAERWETAGELGPARGPQGGHKGPSAHMRRGHFHAYRYGKGRTQTKVKWTAPFPVGVGQKATTVTKFK